jgi:hypothetical protein
MANVLINLHVSAYISEDHTSVGYKCIIFKLSFLFAETACIEGNNPCSQKCTETPKGPICKCFSGFNLGIDGRTCFDINECEAEQGLCSHFCRNTDGGFACSCGEGYSLRSDRQTCKAIGTIGRQCCTRAKMNSFV